MQRRAGVHSLALLLLVICPAGCNSFGNSRLVKELQSENERLLAEFRAQRNRSEELEKTNRLQAERLAESEKLLARMTQGTNSGRLSSLPQPSAMANPLLPLFSPASDNIPSLPNQGNTGRTDPSGLRWLPRADAARP